MSITNGYTTLAELKAWITVRGGTISTDTNDDAVLEDIIESVSRHIDRETGRRFYADGSDGTYYFQAKDSQNIELPEFASITTVAVDYANTRTYTDLAATDFDTLPDNATGEGQPITGLAISPVSTAYFPTQRRGVKITGKRGRSSVPDDIKDCCRAIVQSINGTRSGQTSGGKVTITGAGVVIRPEDVPAFAQKIIEHYRDIR
jgi:hypothetical protein